MDDNDKEKLIEGLELAYKKMVEFKRYKKTSIIVCDEDGKIVEIDPNTVDTSKNVYQSYKDFKKNAIKYENT